MDDSVNSKILKFADDTKIYCAVNSVEGIESLRADLHKLVLRSSEWQMLFSINKPEAHFSMKITQLQAVSEERDLGIIVSADLKWEKQYIAALKNLIKFWV